MSEQPVEPEKKAVEPGEAYRRHIKKMQPKQMLGHIKRQARKNKKRNGSMIDGAWAIVLGTVFENSKLAGAGGKMEHFLR